MNSYFKMPEVRNKKNSILYKVWHLNANPHKRLYFLIFFVFVMFSLVIARLFNLQIINGEKYRQQAFDQQYSKITIPAQRWEIFMTNSKTWELQKIATNVSMDLLYIDPTNIPDKIKIAKEIAPILFDEEDYFDCKKDFRLCPKWSTVRFDEWMTLKEKPLNWSWNALYKDTRTKEELIRDYSDDILRKISKEYNDFLPLKYWASIEEIKQMEELNFAWISINKKQKLIYADPTVIQEIKVFEYARLINKILPENSIDFLEKNLRKRKILYIPLKRKLSSDTSEKIMELKIQSYKLSRESWGETPHYYKWVVLLKEHWRYYPENELWSQIVWFVDHDWIWRYWIEEYYDYMLAWKDWIILNRKNIKWEFVFFDKENIEEPKDWDSVVLTIDKVIQQKVEEILKKWSELTKADGTDIMVMNPKTWEILASASYPTYNPNDYWAVYKIIPIKEFIPPDDSPDLKPESPEEWVRLYYTKPVFIKDKEWNFVAFKADEAKKEDDEIRKKYSESWIVIPRIQKYMYENWFWLRNYINKNFIETYEPWSVFKWIVIWLALDAREVEPSTTYEEFWPIEIDTWTAQKQFIRTAEWVYRWIQTITNAIEQSSNIWLAFVAKKLWKQVFYEYLQEFNFWDTYWIESPWEQTWNLSFWKKWSEAQLFTVSFWQGISVTPLQMVTAYSSLGNWWVLMQPTLIKQFIKANWDSVINTIKILKQIISKEASKQITWILVSSVENWVAKAWWVIWYKIAWKTWTAQIACSDSHRCRIWTYEPKKEWHFITSYWWYAPAENPRFAIIVKVDRARLWPKTYWSNTAAPMFKELAEFLFNYYEIAPEEKKEIGKNK